MSRNRKVLIVEDDLVVAEAYIELLSLYFIPVMANTENEAFEILKSQEIDAVLCDISLGGGSGIRLLEHCRLLKINVPFVMISGDVRKEHLISALRLGAQDVIEKPIRLEYFQTRFKEVVDEGFSLRRINSGIKEVKALIGNTNSGDDLNFVKEYLATVEANRLLKKVG